MPPQPSPFWGACQIDSNGTTYTQKGRHDIVVTSANAGTSSYWISFPEHPDGDRYVVALSSNEYHCFYRDASSTSLQLYIRQGNNSPASSGGNNFINVTILA